MIEVNRTAVIGDQVYTQVITIDWVEVDVSIGEVIEGLALTDPDIDWPSSLRQLGDDLRAYLSRAIRRMPVPREQQKVYTPIEDIHVRISTSIGQDHLQLHNVRAPLGSDLLADALHEELVEALAFYGGWHNPSWVVRVEEA